MEDISGPNLIKMELSEDISESSNFLSLRTECSFGEPINIKVEKCSVEKHDPELFDPNEYMSTEDFVPNVMSEDNCERYNEENSVFNDGAIKSSYNIAVGNISEANDLYPVKIFDNTQENDLIKCEDSNTVIDATKDNKLGIVKFEHAPNNNASLKTNILNSYMVRLCPFCGEKYDKLNTWRLHLEDEHDFNNRLKKCYTAVENTGNQCIECKFLLKSEIALRTHTISHLPYNEIFVCILCGESFAVLKSLHAHIKRSHLSVVGESLKKNTKEQFCLYCEETIGYRDKLFAHIRNEHGEFCKTKMLLICPECGMNFRNNKTYQMHVNSVHKFTTLQGLSFEEIVYSFDKEDYTAPEKRMKYRCIKCDLLMSNCKIDILKQHAVTHFPYKKYKCRYCDFANKSAKKVSVHTCKGCLDAFKYVPKIASKRKSIRRQLWLNRNVRNKTDRVYVCPSCGEEFDTVMLHAYHLKVAHGFENIDSLNITVIKGDVSSDGSSELKHNCKVCNKDFKKPSLTNFKVHAFSHMPFKIYKCTLCHSSSNRLVACLCKDSAVWNGISFICPQCQVQQQFKTEKDWHAHIEQCHPDFLTPIGLNFSQIILLNADQPSYKCNNCGKTEKQLNLNMLLHAIEHMSTKCFKCEKCENSYYSKRDALNDVYNCIWKKPPSQKKKASIRKKNASVRKKKASSVLSTDEKIFAEMWRACAKFAKRQCAVCGCFVEENNDAELVDHLEQVHNLNLESVDDLNFAKCVIQEAAIDQNCLMCLECNQSLFDCSINQLQEHKLMHLSYKMWHCTFCDEKFYTKVKALDHIIDLHLKKKHKRKSDVLSLFSFACPVCNEKCQLYSEWRAHMNTKHGFDTLAGLKLVEENNFLKCIDCSADVREDSKFAHRLYHLPFSSYKCRICNIRYKTYKTAREHAVSCKRKKKILKKLANIKKGQTLSSNTICKVNNELADRPYEIERLKGFISTSAYIVYACVECKIKLSSEMLLYKHITELHNYNHNSSLTKIRLSPYYTLLCKICSHRMKNKSSMIKHMHRKHLANVELKCDICNETAKTHFDFYTHMKTQHADIATWPKNVCPICVEILPIGTNMEFHSKINHLIEGMIDDEKEIDSQLEIIAQDERSGLVIKTAEVIDAPAEMILPDTISKENYETIGQSITTMATCSKNSSALNKYIQYITYACPECNLPLPTQVEWHAHISTEHEFFAEHSLNIKDTPGDGGKSICMECGTTVTSVILHKQRHKLTHMPYRSFICKICFHRSTNQNQLFDHMKNKHFAPGQYKCEMCSLVFQTACDRYTHANEEHKGIKWPTNVCPICVTTLSSRQSMDAHVKIHSFDREQFSCRYCPKNYLSKSDFNRHLKEKHSKEIENEPKTDGKSKEMITPKVVSKSDDEECMESSITFKKKKLRKTNSKKATEIEADDSPKSKRGRPKKILNLDLIKSSQMPSESEGPGSSRRKRGRPRKTPNVFQIKSETSVEIEAFDSSKRKRGRPRKTDSNSTFDLNEPKRKNIIPVTSPKEGVVDQYSDLGSITDNNCILSEPIINVKIEEY